MWENQKNQKNQSFLNSTFNFPFDGVLHDSFFFFLRFIIHMVAHIIGGSCIKLFIIIA
jgi:hypothetical protein